MARKKTNPTLTPIDPAELEAEVSRIADADPEAARAIGVLLTSDPAAPRGAAIDMSGFLGRFLQVYDALDRIGVIEWIRKRRAGSA